MSSLTTAKSLQTVERAVDLLARLSAIAGGLVLIGLVIMTTASIAGRSLAFVGLAPLPGDFELVEMGMAFAIFAFLPWCHLRNSHASVDIIVARFGRRARRLLAIVSDTLMFAAALIIAWRLALGMLDKKAYGETTYLLQIPLWWGYAASLFGASIFLLVAARCLLVSLCGQER